MEIPEILPLYSLGTTLSTVSSTIKSDARGLGRTLLKLSSLPTRPSSHFARRETLCEKLGRFTHFDPLLRALWEAPFLSALGDAVDFEQLHQAYNAPAIVIVEGNDVDMAADGGYWWVQYKHQFNMDDIV